MDYRERLLKKFEMIIIKKIPEEYIQMVSNCMLMALDDYEITPRCTEIAVPDTSNETILKIYASSLLIEGKSKHTIKAYVNELRRFGDFIRKDYTQAGAIDLRRYIASKMGSGVSESTCETLRSYVSAFYAWLTEEGYTESNAMARVKPIKFKVTKEDPFSSTEISSMRDAIKDIRLRAMFEFLLSTGVRANELCNIKLEDVNMQTMAVHVVCGKGNKERITFMNATAKMYIEKYLEIRKHKSVFLFCNDRGGSQMTTDNIRKHLKNIQKDSGIENVHPHRFRHTFASRLAKAGMPPQEVQLLLGHSSLTTTMIYVTTEEDMIRNSYMRYVS